LNTIKDNSQKINKKGIGIFTVLFSFGLIFYLLILIIGILEKGFISDFINIDYISAFVAILAILSIFLRIRVKKYLAIPFPILLSLIFIVLLGWAVTKNVPIRDIVFKQDFASGDYGRISQPNKHLNITENPDYNSNVINYRTTEIRIYKSKYYQNAKIELRYENIDQDIVKIGQSGKMFTSLENRIIDGMGIEDNYKFYTVQKDDNDNPIFLWSKEENNLSLPDFFSSLSKDKTLAIYKLDNLWNYIESLRLLNISKKNNRFPVAIRGSHSFIFLVNGKDSEISFSLLDKNEAKGKDNIQIIMAKNGKDIVFQQDIADDNNQSANKKTGNEKDITISSEDIDRGFYTLKIKATKDIYVKNLSVKEGAFAIKDNMNCADSDKQQTVFVSGRHISIIPKHKAGLQQVTVGGKSVLLDEVDKPVGLDVEYGTEINIPVCDVYLWTDGIIADNMEILEAVSPANIFDITNGDELKDADYFLTRYKKQYSGIKTIYLNNLGKSDQPLKLKIDLPLFQPGQQGIILKEMKVTYSRQPFR